MNIILKILSVLIILIYSANAQSVGTQAPNFTHTTLDHGQISLTDYHGKVVYLFFFGWG